MPYAAIVPGTIVLAYLRERSIDSDGIPLDVFAGELKEIEESLADIRPFNFCEEEAVKNPELGRVLKMLEACSYLDFDLKENYVRITPRGEGFAESLDVPIEVRRCIEKQIIDVESSRYSSYQVSSVAGYPDEQREISASG